MKKQRRLNNKQKQFLTKNFNLVNKYYEENIRKRNIPQRWEDDFFSHLMERFCYAVLSYKPESGFKFSTYAYGGFNFGKKEIIKKVIRTKFIPQGQVKDKLDKWYCEDKNNKKILWDSISKGETSVVNREKVRELIKNANLNSTEKMIIELYFLEGWTYLDLGNKMKLTKERIRQIIMQIIIKIREYTVKNGIEMKDFFETIS